MIQSNFSSSILFFFLLFSTTYFSSSLPFSLAEHEKQSNKSQQSSLSNISQLTFQHSKFATILHFFISSSFSSSSSSSSSSSPSSFCSLPSSSSQNPFLFPRKSNQSYKPTFKILEGFLEVVTRSWEMFFKKRGKKERPFLLILLEKRKDMILLRLEVTEAMGINYLKKRRERREKRE